MNSSQRHTLIKPIDKVSEMNRLTETVKEKMKNKYINNVHKLKNSTFSHRESFAQPTNTFFRHVDDLRSKSNSNIGKGIYNRKSATANLNTTQSELKFKRLESEETNITQRPES